MRKVELLPTRDCEAGYGPAWKCDEAWAIPKFWQRSDRFTDSSLDLPVFLVARATFTYSF